MQSEARVWIIWNIFAYSGGGTKFGAFLCYFQWRMLKNNEILELYFYIDV
jgi:hypothetical protein